MGYITQHIERNLASKMNQILIDFGILPTLFVSASSSTKWWQISTFNYLVWKLEGNMR